MTLPVPFYAKYGPSLECTMGCVGDDKEMCGGLRAIAVYSVGSFFLAAYPMWRMLYCQ